MAMPESIKVSGVALLYRDMPKIKKVGISEKTKAFATIRYSPLMKLEPKMIASAAPKPAP